VLAPGLCSCQVQSAAHLHLTASSPHTHCPLQGGIEPKRRDYDSAFAAASHPAVLEQLRQRNESLLLVGSGTGEWLSIPEELQPFVKIVSDLPYQVGAADGEGVREWQEEGREVFGLVYTAVQHAARQTRNADGAEWLHGARAANETHVHKPQGSCTIHVSSNRRL